MPNTLTANYANLRGATNQHPPGEMNQCNQSLQPPPVNPNLATLADDIISAAIIIEQGLSKLSEKLFGDGESSPPTPELVSLESKLTYARERLNAQVTRLYGIERGVA